MGYDIGPKIGIDGEAEFRAAIKNLNTSLQTMTTEMKAVVSAYDAGDRSEERLTAQNKVLTKQIAAQKDKLSELQNMLKKSAEKYGDADEKTQRWQQAVYRATADLNKMERELKDNNGALSGFADKADDAEDSVKDFGDSVGEVEDSVSGFGSHIKEAFTFGAVSGAIQSLIGKFSEVIGETEEYRKIMGSLDVSSQKAGYSTDQTSESYKRLYGVLGDDQTAATSLANLQALHLSQKDLTSMIDGAIGAWATYGDSIPIDSLSEAVNETIKTGVVTGTFADMLNWAGTSEDDFNVKLASCKTQSERANTVLQEMNKQGLQDAAQGWRDNNKAMVDANETSVDTSDTMAQIAEKVQPAFTAVKKKILDIVNGMVDMVSGFKDAAENGSPLIPILSGIGAALVTFGTGLQIVKGGGIAEAISGIGSAIGGAFGRIADVASVPMLIITAIVAIAAALITLYNTNENFRNAVNTAWGAILSVVTTVGSAIAGFFTQTIPNAINSMVAFFQSLPATIGALFTQLWTSISTFFTQWVPSFISSVGTWFSQLPERIGYALGFALGKLVSWGISAVQWAATAIPNLISAIGTFFQQLPGRIAGALVNALASIRNWITNCISAVRTGFPNLVSSVVSFFQQLPGRIAGALAAVVSSIRAWASRLISTVRSGLASLPGTIVGIFQQIPGQLLNVGANIINGLWNGIQNAVGGLLTKVRGVGDSIVRGFKDALGIHSPSVLAFQIGVYWMIGLANGFKGGYSSTEKTIKTVCKDLSTAMTDEIDKLNSEVAAIEAQAQKEQSEKELAEYKKSLAEKNAALAQAGESDRATILADIAKLQSDWDEKQLQAQRTADKKALNAKVSALSEIQKAYESALSEIEKSEDTMSDKLSSYGNLLVKTTSDTGDVFELGDLQGQIDKISAYGDALEKIKARGTPESLMSEITSMSVDDATGYLDKLLSMSDDKYSEYINKWSEKQELSGSISKEFYADKLKEVQSEYIDKIPGTFTELKGQLKTLGEDSADSIADGLKQNQSSIFDTLKNLMQSAIANATQSLSGVKSAIYSSPSNSAAAIDNQTGTIGSMLSGAVNAIGTMISGQSNAQPANIVLQTRDGQTMARWIIQDLRAVSKSTPEVVSDPL